MSRPPGAWSSACSQERPRCWQLHGVRGDASLSRVRWFAGTTQKTFVMNSSRVVKREKQNCASACGRPKRPAICLVIAIPPNWQASLSPWYKVWPSRPQEGRPGRNFAASLGQPCERGPETDDRLEYTVCFFRLLTPDFCSVTPT